MNIKILKAMNEVFKRLNNLRRWTAVLTESRYDEISKQALNCIICFFLATEAEARGVPVRWERFPKIAIFRAFQKAYVFYDTPEHICKEICEINNIAFEQEFLRVTLEIIEEYTDEGFSTSLKEGCGTSEEVIYKAATKIATLLELRENEEKFNGEYLKELENIIKSMAKYENIPGFIELSDSDSSFFKAFKKVSKLRNQNRWAAYSYRVACSVLGHLFDTAIFAYLMAIEKGESEEVATKYFFIGVFHDLPEAFTRDIPSPIKDRIPGFRRATEKYELFCMDEYFYPLLSDISKKAVRGIMLEDEENEKYKKLIKGADYLSATSEIWRQFEDVSLLEAMKNHGSKFESPHVEITEAGSELYRKQLSWIKEAFKD